MADVLELYDNTKGFPALHASQDSIYFERRIPAAQYVLN
jgi:hypothetical protein